MFEITALEYQYPNSSFSVNIEQLPFKRGEIVALIGANGCGKSTFYKLMTGAINPTRSLIHADHFFYKSILHTPYKIGFHNAFSSLIETLTVRQNAMYLARLNNVDNPGDRIEMLAKEFGVLNLLDRKPPSLSSGQSHRAKLIRTLVHDPDIICLDEPTTASDIAQIEIILETIKRLSTQNKLVFISTHHLYELSVLKPRVIGMSHGRILIDSKWKVDFDDPLILRASIQSLMNNEVATYECI